MGEKEILNGKRMGISSVILSPSETIRKDWIPRTEENWLFLANCLSIIPLSAFQYLPFQMQSLEAAPLRPIFVSSQFPRHFSPCYSLHHLPLHFQHSLTFPPAPTLKFPCTTTHSSSPLSIAVLGGKKLLHFFSSCRGWGMVWTPAGSGQWACFLSHFLRGYSQGCARVDQPSQPPSWCAARAEARSP